MGDYDLPSELRRIGKPYHNNTLVKKYMFEAANEIERLRELCDLWVPSTKSSSGQAFAPTPPVNTKE